MIWAWSRVDLYEKEQEQGEWEEEEEDNDDDDDDVKKVTLGRLGRWIGESVASDERKPRRSNQPFANKC